MTYAVDSCEFLAQLHDNLSLVLVMIAISQKNSHETTTKTNQLLKPHQCQGKVGNSILNKGKLILKETTRKFLYWKIHPSSNIFISFLNQLPLNFFFCSLYEDDFDEDEDLAEGDIMALKGLENDDDLGTGNNNKNKPWTMVTGIDDDVDDDDDDDDFY